MDPRRTPLPSPLRALGLAPAALLALLLGACDSSSTASSERCDVVLSALSPDEAVAGDAVVISGKPMTTVWDSAVYVDRTRAELRSVDRDGCDACDTCRDDNDCTDCSDCDACDALCDRDCAETATFVVPVGLSGQLPVRLFNVHGESGPLTLNVSGGDTAAQETGETGAETGGETGNTGETAETGAETGTETGAETGTAP